MAVFGRKHQPAPEPQDPTKWLIDSELAAFLLMNTYYIKYMAMLFYTYYTGRLDFGFQGQQRGSREA
jgi:hypothetical protein